MLNDLYANAANELKAIRAESLHDSVLTGMAPEEWEPLVAVSAASSETGVTGAVNASTARKLSDGTFLFRPYAGSRIGFGNAALFLAGDALASSRRLGITW